MSAPPPLTPPEIAALLDVSRETLDRLHIYLDVLTKWQPRINLVGASTLRDPWRRHILDSAQLFPLLPPGTQTLVDLGSGAGFPGLVLAILGVASVHLVESDHRKAAFLREAARLTTTPVTVHPQRLESLASFPVDAVTARALAPLPRLLDLAAPFLCKGAVGLFLKGQSVDDELTESHKIWKMRVERLPSRSDPAGFVLRIGDLRRV